MSVKSGAKTKGWIKNNVTGEKKSFQFNPKELEHSRGATYVEITAPGMSYPNTQFVKGESRSFPVELFFYDNPYTGVIDKHVSFLEGFLPPEVNTAGFKKPPSMTFCYGTFIKKCVVEELSVRAERMDEYGRFTQAYITLQLKQVGV